VTKPVKDLVDVKGMKLATQPAASTAVEAVKGIPVTSSLPEVYTMLEKGIADGSALAWGAFKAYKIYEVTKYHINPHLGGVPYCHIMNNARWKGLSDAHKSIITDVTQKMLPDALCKAVTKEANTGMLKSKERGDEIIDLTPEQRQQWIATASSDWDAWAAEMEKKGLPGKAVLQEAIKLVEKYKDYDKKHLD
jgi:TRAP-type C4-dicarboxylate transport system substrate-binding protein